MSITDLPTKIGSYEEQSNMLPTDIGEMFDARIQYVEGFATSSGSINLKWTVQVLAPNKYAEEIYDVYHGWGRKITKYSGMALAIQNFQKAGIEDFAKDCLAKVCTFKKLSMSELKGYDEYIKKRIAQDKANNTPEGKRFTGEKFARYYITAVKK